MAKVTTLFPGWWRLEIFKLEKGVIIELNRKGGGLERHASLYLKCRAKC